jgi:hypothetical protein
MIDPSQLPVWVATAKGSLDLLKSAWEIMPKGEKRDAVEHELIEAERALTSANAKLAHELEYKLCQCTFPPQIMLWNNAEDAHICPNPTCGHRIQRPKATRVVGPSWGRSRRS